MGRSAVREPAPRRVLDGAELRPGTRTSGRRNLGHLAGAQVPARRPREEAPVPQQHPGPGDRYRRGALVLPAPERPLGSGSSLRAVARRHGGRAGRRRRRVAESADRSGRDAQGRDRRSGQDRPCLHPRPRDRRVPVGPTDGAPERDRADRRRDRRGGREPGSRVHRAGTGTPDLPVAPRRQGLGGGRLQSADEHDVLPAPEPVLPDDDPRGPRRDALRTGERHPVRTGEGTARRGLRDLRRDR